MATAPLSIPKHPPTPQEGGAEGEFSSLADERIVDSHRTARKGQGERVNFGNAGCCRRFQSATIADASGRGREFGHRT